LLTGGKRSRSALFPRKKKAGLRLERVYAIAPGGAAAGQIAAAIDKLHKGQGSVDINVAASAILNIGNPEALLGGLWMVGRLDSCTQPSIRI
jgi:hypothetical protein